MYRNMLEISPELTVEFHQLSDCSILGQVLDGDSVPVECLHTERASSDWLPVVQHINIVLAWKKMKKNILVRIETTEILKTTMQPTIFEIIIKRILVTAIYSHIWTLPILFKGKLF